MRPWPEVRDRLRSSPSPPAPRRGRRPRPAAGSALAAHGGPHGRARGARDRARAQRTAGPGRDRWPTAWTAPTRSSPCAWTSATARALAAPACRVRWTSRARPRGSPPPRPRSGRSTGTGSTPAGVERRSSVPLTGSLNSRTAPTGRRTPRSRRASSVEVPLPFGRPLPPRGEPRPVGDRRGVRGRRRASRWSSSAIPRESWRSPPIASRAEPSRARRSRCGAGERRARVGTHGREGPAAARRRGAARDRGPRASSATTSRSASRRTSPPTCPTDGSMPSPTSRPTGPANASR